ncbi:unnamed protein product [Calypogeia fissa]
MTLLHLRDLRYSSDSSSSRFARVGGREAGLGDLLHLRLPDKRMRLAAVTVSESNFGRNGLTMKGVSTSPARKLALKE